MYGILGSRSVLHDAKHISNYDCWRHCERKGSYYLRFTHPESRSLGGAVRWYPVAVWGASLQWFGARRCQGAGGLLPIISNQPRVNHVLRCWHGRIHLVRETSRAGATSKKNANVGVKGEIFAPKAKHCGPMRRTWKAAIRRTGDLSA